MEEDKKMTEEFLDEKTSKKKLEKKDKNEKSMFLCYARLSLGML